MTSTKFDDLMNKEMTRKQFLIALGLGFLSLFGLPAILGMMNNGIKSDRHTAKGYGVNRYGSS